MKIGDLMNNTKLLGILLILLGIIFIAYPLVSASVVSIFAGLSLISLGLVLIFNAFSLWSIATGRSVLEVLLGFFLMLLGFMFFVDLAPLAFLTAYNFYLIAIILMIVGIFGIVYGEGISKWGSVLTLILGIIAFLLGVFAISDPLLIVVLIGVVLIVRGVLYFTVGGAFDKIDSYEGN